jgi:haloalkane dehalogenase
MTDIIRTPDENFAGLTDFPFAPHYHQSSVEDLRVHYVDEGPRDGPVALMTHGMPTWAYLYRDMIPPMVAAGYRCIAPDHVGFGRSDKVADDDWYSIAKHTEVLTDLIASLDLKNITLFCQDWGGPIGLAQAATMPERFARLCIMNTWLHHEGFEYTEAIRGWNASWHDGGRFARPCPPVQMVPLFSAGLVKPEDMQNLLGEGVEPRLSGDTANRYTAYKAPFAGLKDGAYCGARRFPLSICFDNPEGGNAKAQESHFETLKGWRKPVHFVWGGLDGVFNESWGREWASIFSGATFDLLPDANHFLQDTHGAQIIDIALKRISEE